MAQEADFIPGYLLGFRYPVISLRLESSSPNPERVRALDSVMRQGLGTSWTIALDPQEATPNLLRLIVDQVVTAMDAAILEKPRLIPLQGNQQHLLVPCHQVMEESIRHVLNHVAWFLTTPAERSRRKEVLTALASDLPFIIKSPFRTLNTKLFLEAAYAMKVPAHPRGQDLIDYGFGCFLKRMQSSFTSKTSAVATQLARDKKQAGDILRATALPGSDLRIVTNEQHAVVTARELGFPVVLKPQCLDGGVGVHANLGNATEVKTAFRALRRLSNQIVMERHFQGRDYRLVVHEHRLIWAIEKEYPGVRGTGVDPIRKLVERENQDPLRAETASSVLVPLRLDAESLACLRKQGLNADSIPAAGTFVRLREKSNVNTGGRPVIFPIETIHPDNIQLAEDVSRCIGLDLAGIDILTKDLGVSWREAGALVCDVNAQPSFGTLTSRHLYEQVLRTEMKEGSAPPIMIVACAVSKDRLKQLGIEHQLSLGLRSDWGSGLGMVCQGQAYLADKPINLKPLSTFDAASALLRRTTLQVLLLSSHGDLHETGLPHFAVQVMLLPSDYLNLTQAEQQKIKMMLVVTLPHCQNLIIAESVDKAEPTLIHTLRRHFPTLNVTVDRPC
jgi:cyanophycin synthetase